MVLPSFSLANGTCLYLFGRHFFFFFWGGGGELGFGMHHGSVRGGGEV